MDISLDSSDIKILNLIQNDATLTNQEIAEITGVSATSVWRRIKNLEEVGVIKGTVALLDQKKTKLNVCAMIHVRLNRHGEDTRVEFEDFIDEDEVRDILRESPGILVVDKREDGGYITPVECVGEYATYISRIRQDSTIENGINLWCVSDNLRKGAALNAIQIAELLGRRVLKKG